MGGILLGYGFIMEHDFLKGRNKLNAPVHTLLSAKTTRKRSSDVLNIRPVHLVTYDHQTWARLPVI